VTIGLGSNRGDLTVEWTTQSEQHPETGNGNYVDPQATQPLPAPAHPTPQAAPALLPTASHEQCPSCGALVMSDQRYCLACGQRRGDPRLPFMDAVVFMDAMKSPAQPQSAPARKKPRKVSPNAALIAGVGTLLLALGLGVLIGRSGGETAPAPQQAPIVIKGAGESATETPAAAPTTATTGGSGGTKGKPKKAVANEKQHAAESGKGAEEVLKPTTGVNLPPPTTSVGDKCAKGTAGCENGKFTGSFFGE
jgi:hypothetical protein